MKYSDFHRVHISLSLAFGFICLSANQTHAATLYATSISGSQIDQVDTVTQAVTTYLNTPSAADSLMFDSAGNVIYDQLYTGQVRRYDPNTFTDTLVASGLNGPADMVLEPGGNTMLVSEFYGAQVDRINLNTLTKTVLPIPGVVYAGPEGLAYDGSRLFVSLGARAGGPTGKYIAEVNPVTGAIISQSPGLNDLDGLTFDPYSGLLYASSYLGSSVYGIDPNNLNNVITLTTGGGGGSGSGGGTATVPFPDGITADGLGNIFIASSDDSGGDGHIYQFNIPSNTLTQNAFVAGLDDLAPASGPGSLPEPNGLLLVILSLGCLMIGRRQRPARA